MKRWLFLLLCVGVLATKPVMAGQIEIIQLHNRTAQELLPLIKPHLSATASLTGTDHRLIIRADEPNIAIAKRLASELDLPPRSVLVSVRQGGASSAHGGGIGASGDSRSGARIQIHRSNTARSSHGEQQIRGLDGRRLQIVTRTLLPVTGQIVWFGQHSAGSARQTQLIELDSGLYALPRLQGNHLEVDILVQDRAQDDPLTSRRVVTTVSGQPGEWIAFASTGDSATNRDRSVAQRSGSARHQTETLWLRVDVLD